MKLIVPYYVLITLAAGFETGETDGSCQSSECKSTDEDASSLLAMHPRPKKVIHPLPGHPFATVEMPPAHLNLVNPPPLYRIHAANLYDAGFQHGIMAKERIQGWFKTSGMMSLFQWIGIDGNRTDGREAFETMKRANEKVFPTYVLEMEGIAKGAEVHVDRIWVANLLEELHMYKINTEQAPNDYDHCGDIFAISKGGYAKGFCLGHNEDEHEIIKPFLYFMSYSFPSSKPGFTNCAGLAYPGTVTGATGTWNEHGIYSTQDAIHVHDLRPDGLSSTFVQRRAVCEARNMDEAIARMSVPGWILGTSTNLVDLREKRMVNMEVAGNYHHALEITEKMGNYSHFNEFKHIEQFYGKELGDSPSATDEDRQGEVDASPPPNSTWDIMVLLSHPEIRRPNTFETDKTTIATNILDGSSGQLNIWCCGIAPTDAPDTPAYSWNLWTFFDVPR